VIDLQVIFVAFNQHGRLCPSESTRSAWHQMVAQMRYHLVPGTFGLEAAGDVFELFEFFGPVAFAAELGKDLRETGVAPALVDPGGVVNDS